MKNQNRLFVFIIILLFLGINAATLHGGHDWGGDFAQYIKHALNLCENKEYAESFDLDPGSIVPPGFPLLLWPFVKAAGLNLKVFKLINILFWPLYVWALFEIAKVRLGRNAALMISVILLSSPYFFILKQSIISDVPFLFFTTAALWCWILYFSDETQNKKRSGIFLFFALVTMSYALLIRFAGIALVLSVIFYAALFHRNKKLLFYLAGSLMICISIQYSFGVNAVPHVTAAGGVLRQWMGNLPAHLSYILIQYIIFFFPFKTTATIFIFTIVKHTVYAASFLVILLIGMMLAGRIRRKSISVLECFFIFYLFLLIFFPVRGGVRYLLPIIGPGLILGIEGIYGLAGFIKRPVISKEKIVIGFLAVILFHNIISIALNFRYSKDAIGNDDFRALTEWIKANSAEEDSFMFHRPRILGLFTGRKVTAMNDPYVKESSFERIQRHHIRYVVVMKASPVLRFKQDNLWNMTLEQLTEKEFIEGDSGTEGVVRELRTKGLKLTVRWENERYRILAVVRD